MGDTGWIVVTVMGLCLGVGLGFWLGRSYRGSDTAKLAEAEAELAGYKAKVTEHFSQAASHFQAIGRQYRELYEHMAAGSQDLCEQAGSDNPLKFPAPEAVAALADDRATRPSTMEASERAGPVDYPMETMEDAEADDVPPRPAAEASAAPEGAQEASASERAGDAVGESAEEQLTPGEAEAEEPDKRLYH